MAGKEPVAGQTATTVAENIGRLRTGQNLTYTQLSERLKDKAAWDISPVAVRRIEDNERRVSVDDLMALAVALRVSPITLLMPDSVDRDTPVTVTGITERYAADLLWKWLRADWALPRRGDDASELFDLVAPSLPAWERREYAERVTDLIRIDRLSADMKAGGERAEAARREWDRIVTGSDGDN
ncbi:helix-turn-helix domain-containing protein [Mycobacterium sp. NPDC050041]|uniref:helix-turn-helix domain-containing protein n=1 Tax=Mycobacterium sp. NPDC050041 TaxID=3364293 RepID=UPI003C2F6A19